MLNNLTSLIIVFFAAKLMTHTEYFKVGIMTTIIATYSLVLDFGFNTSLVKFSIDDKDFRHNAFSFVLSLKTIITITLSILIVFLNSSLNFSGISASELVWSLCFGWALSVWTSLRAFNQSDGTIHQSIRRIYIYALSRICLAILFLVLQRFDALSLNWSLYLIPLIISSFFDISVIFSKTNRFSLNHEHKKKLASSFIYGMPVWLSSIVYILLTRLLVMYEADLGNKVASSSFNLALSYVAFVGLLNDSFRYILLPKVVLLNTKTEILNGWRNLNKKAPLLLFAFLASLLLFASINYFLFENKYPQSTIFLVIIYLSYSINSLIGLYNIYAHSVGVPQLDLISNILRLSIFLLILYLFKPDSIISALTFGIILISSEIMVQVILRTKVAVMTE